MLLLAVSLIFTALFCSDVQSQPALVPANCRDVEKNAEVALDLINKHRRDDGYVFSLLRVANAHVQEAKNVSILYLTLDVMETECPVLSRKHWTSCDSRKFIAITDFGQCKTIVYIHQDSKKAKLSGYNCTVSSVPPHLFKCVDCPVRITIIEDVDQHEREAEKILENYKQKNNETTYFKVEKVQKVFKAEASHTGYVIEFIIKEVKVPSNGLSTNASECEFLPDGYARRGFCTGRVVYGTEEGEVTEAESCEIYDTHDLGGHHHHDKTPGHGCRCSPPHHHHHRHHHHCPHHHHTHHHHSFGHRHGQRHGHECPPCPDHNHHDPKRPIGHHNSSEDSHEEYADFPPPRGPNDPHSLPPGKNPPPIHDHPHHNHEHHGRRHHGRRFHGHHRDKECPPCPDHDHLEPKGPMGHHNSSHFPPPPGPRYPPPPSGGPHHLPPSNYPPPPLGPPPPPGRHHDHPTKPFRDYKCGHRHRYHHDCRCNRTSNERGRGSSHEDDSDSFRDLDFFPRSEMGSVYRILIVGKDDVLQPPSANFFDHSCSSRRCHDKHPFPSKGRQEKPIIQHFPEIISESCPGDAKYNPLGILALYPPPFTQ